jgi:hypothetical protein
MLVRMSDEKQSTSEPTVVFTTSQMAGDMAKSIKSRITKKHVLIAVISLLITGLAVTAVLVSIRMIADNNLEMLKYSIQAKGVSQNVSVDKNTVSYHVKKNEVEAWIVDDFDKGLQVSKVLVDGKTICYVSALNRSMAQDASSIPSTAPADASSAPSNSVIYQVMPEPISDLSFLGQKASDMCQNIPTHHVVPDCGKTQDNKDIGLQNSTAVDHRSKRTPAFCATCNRYNCLCACGCCSMVCAWFSTSTYILRYANGVWYCTYYYVPGYLYAVYTLRPTCAYSGRYYNP